ncbi:MAG: PTS sugar transporter subunit IIA [Candidatus Hydrogenedentes bacterium]|nr:PTS sugar transporter subunit IIA [Candidatus Hydrogenedentota bacterium]
MELHKTLTENAIWIGVADMTKWQVLEDLVGRLPTPPGARPPVLAAVLDREHRSSTGVGGGIAIPHARTSHVSTLSIALAISRNGFDFESLDGRPCHLVFLVVAPPDASTRYLDALASIASLAVNPGHVASLIQCATPAEALSLLETVNGKRHTAASTP